MWANHRERAPSRQRNSEGPYIVAALLVERLLVEQDSTVSAIRIVDRFHAEGIAQVIAVTGTDVSSAYLPIPEPVEFTLLIMAKDFPHEGADELTIELIDPLGQSPLGVAEQIVDINGSLHGGSLAVPVKFALGVGGIHWISIRYHGRELTRSAFEFDDQRIREVIASDADIVPGATVYQSRGASE